MEHDSCFGFKSPFGFLIDINAKNLFINLDYKNSGLPFYMLLKSIKINYRYFKKFKGNIIKKTQKRSSR